MLGLNYMAWLGLLVWVGVPFFALLTGVLLWRRSRTPLWRGFAIISCIAILLAPMLVSNRVKAHYDQQVREMCAKDGGVRVYETVRLPAEEFDEFGDIRIPANQNAKPKDEYLYESSTTYIRDRNPEIWKSHYRVHRQLGGKLLGESVSYSRRGGDMPGPWHESSFGCPRDADITDLNRQIFVKN